jgi:phosphoribosylformylglycinamidine cyclo-ligase
VEEDEALHGDRISAGDVLIAYASTGLHTNGYTLGRRVLLDLMGLSLDATLPGTDTSVGDALLAVHRSYVDAIRPVLGAIHGMAHITGGGIGGNLVRVLPKHCDAVIDTKSWEWPPLFRVIATGGDVSVAEMREVFNLGVGMIAAVLPEDAGAVHAAARNVGVPTWNCGAIRPGSRRVVFAE